MNTFHSISFLFYGKVPFNSFFLIDIMLINEFYIFTLLQKFLIENIKKRFFK